MKYSFLDLLAIFAKSMNTSGVASLSLLFGIFAKPQEKPFLKEDRFS